MDEDEEDAVDDEQRRRMDGPTVTGAVDGSPRRPVVPALTVSALLLAGVVIAAVLLPAPIGAPAPAASRPVPLAPPARHVFSEATGLSMVIDVGASGLVAVDLDRGLARRFPFAGKRDGSHLAQVGDRFVFATVDLPESVPLDLTGSPQPIGTRAPVSFLPAGETDRVWLLYGSAAEGGRADLLALAESSDGGSDGPAASVSWPAGTATPAALVDRVLALVPGADPAVGWRRPGAANTTPLDDAGRCPSGLAQSGATIVVAVPSSVGACNAVQRVGADRMAAPSVTVPGIAIARPVAVAPGGERVLVDGLDAGGGELGSWIVDFATRQARRVAPLPPAASTRAAWSPDGDRLVVLSTRDGVTSLGLYDDRTDRYDALPLPLDPVGGDAALDQVAAEGIVLVPAGSGPTLGETSLPCDPPAVGDRGPGPVSNVGLVTCRLPGLRDPSAALVPPGATHGPS